MVLHCNRYAIYSSRTQIMVSCAGGSAGHNGSRNDGQQLGRPPDTGLYIGLDSSGGGRSSTCSESPHSHSLSPILHWNGKCAFCEAAAAASKGFCRSAASFCSVRTAGDCALRPVHSVPHSRNREERTDVAVAAAATAVAATDASSESNCCRQTCCVRRQAG